MADFSSPETVLAPPALADYRLVSGPAGGAICSWDNDLCGITLNGSLPGAALATASGDCNRDMRNSEPFDAADVAPDSEASLSPGDAASWRRRPLYGAFYGLNEPPFDLTPNP